MKFPHLSYSIVHVNALRMSVRESLLKWASALFVESSEKPSTGVTLSIFYPHVHLLIFVLLGFLRLIFTESVGMEVFSFLSVDRVP